MTTPSNAMEYPSKEICGIYGMYLQELVDRLRKPSYPKEMLAVIDDLKEGVRDMTFEFCLPDDLRADLINMTSEMSREPTKENYDKIVGRIEDEMVSSFMDEVKPGYTPDRKSGSNWRI